MNNNFLESFLLNDFKKIGMNRNYKINFLNIKKVCEKK